MCVFLGCVFCVFVFFLGVFFFGVCVFFGCVFLCVFFPGCVFFWCVFSGELGRSDPMRAYFGWARINMGAKGTMGFRPEIIHDGRDRRGCWILDVECGSVGK